MKKVIIEIETENAVFEDDPIPELKHILNALVLRIEYLYLHESYPIQDSKGNKVGTIKFLED